MRNSAKVFMIFLLIGFGRSAEAKDWAVDYTNSHLGFTGAASGQAFQGAFKKFDAKINFDPDHPETGKITVTVDIASAATGDGEKDSMLPQADWFDTAKFPQAQFTANTIKKTGANAFEAQGNLTIKGVTQPVTLPFTLQQEGDHWRAQGKTTLTRTTFHIGTGQWASDETVKLGVDVTVDLAAKPQS